MTLTEIQIALKAFGIDPGPIDGEMRPGGPTEKAVKVFQSGHGLVPDGKPGKQTQIALKQALLAPKPGKPEPDKSAIAQPVPPTSIDQTTAAPPPNAEALALLPTARPIHTIWIHCTATAEGKDYTVADIRAWHKARSFSDIGYHYVVQRSGRIDIGRPVGQVGAHVADHNTGSIGISYIGGVTADGKTPKDTRTPAQRASLLWLVRQLRSKHKGIKRVRGHNEAAAKACPSFTVAKDKLGAV